MNTPNLSQICFQPTRRQWLSSAAAMTLPLTPLGATAGWIDDARKLVSGGASLHIGLVDVSLSPSASDAVALYTRATRAFFDKAKAGDALVAGTIGDQRMDRVRPKTVSLARTGKMFEDKRLLKTGIEEIMAWVDQELAKPKVAQSRYIETLAVHQPTVMAGLREGAVVRVLAAGDGVESSELANFEDTKFDARQIDSLIDQLAKRRMLLTDITQAATGRVELMLVGAGGRTEVSWQRVRAFWEAYCTKSGIKLAHYGADLPPFL